jgi:hypothetical protein
MTNFSISRMTLFILQFACALITDYNRKMNARFLDESDAVKRHIGIVINAVSWLRIKIPWTTGIHDELISDGMMTILKCVRKANRGEHDETITKFSTYLTRAVQQNLMRRVIRCKRRNRFWRRSSNREGEDMMHTIEDRRSLPESMIPYDEPELARASQYRARFTGSLCD